MKDCFEQIDRAKRIAELEVIVDYLDEKYKEVDNDNVPLELKLGKRSVIKELENEVRDALVEELRVYVENLRRTHETKKN